MSRNSWEIMEICLMVKFNVFPSKKRKEKKKKRKEKGENVYI
jgi:hypothetical protein